MLFYPGQKFEIVHGQFSLGRMVISKVKPYAQISILYWQTLPDPYILHGTAPFEPRYGFTSAREIEQRVKNGTLRQIGSGLERAIGKVNQTH